jgi:hypothetical protein
MSEDEEREALERFLLDNPELDSIEGALSQFNVFETLNMVNAEVRHSNLLGWLLSPYSNHGLGDYFLRQFLKHFVVENKETLTQLTLFDIELLNLSEAEVTREWNNIDLLIVVEDEARKLAIAVENKIKTAEHSNQLQRYREILEREYPNHLKLFIYLTPENTAPSDEKWFPFSYSVVASLIDSLLKYRRGTLSDNIVTFITQYSTILRRYIVGNSEIEQICREIYKKHKTALDLIFQYKPDLELDISEYLQQKIGASEKLILDTGSKSYIRFTTKFFDDLIEKVSEGWTKSKRIFLFEFNNTNSRLDLKLYIGPGPKDYRESLFKVCVQAPSLFKLAKPDKYFGTKWQSVYQEIYLTKKEIEGAALEDLSKHIDEKWDHFVSTDLPKIESHFKEHWHSPASKEA